jgi:hypothetical protein
MSTSDVTAGASWGAPCEAATAYRVSSAALAGVQASRATTLPRFLFLAPHALVDSVNSPVYKSAHRIWMGQDQANLSSIQGSLTPAVAGLIVFAKTSHEAWTILERSFVSQLQARASALRRELGDCEKLDSMATEFYNKIKALADTLASIGQPLTDSEFNSFIVNGLDEEYDGLVEIINERGNSTPMMAQKVYSRLLLTEQRVEARRANCSRGSHSANAAYKGGRPSSGALMARY